MSAAGRAFRSAPRPRSLRETAVEAALLGSAAVGVLTTVGIVLVLVFETFEFFRAVSPVEYLTGTVWSANIAPYAFGVLPLLVGTLMVATIAMVIAVPFGLLAAVYLAEFASPRVRNVVKPALEVLAGIPTIVYGFFAITVVSPLLRSTILPGLRGLSALSAGIVVGILVLPLVASLSEDALRAVPRSLREGSLALGATRFETVRRVLFPAAISGIAAAVILALSRAVGETMAVVLAAGMNPTLTFNPTDSVQTMTAFIVQTALGDNPPGSLQFKAIFAVGATLFTMTLVLNILSSWVVRRFRNTYE